MRESQGELEPHFGKKKWDQSGSLGRKRWTSQEGRQVPRRASREGLSNRSERVNERKNALGESAESCFTSSLAKSEM